MFHGFQGVPIVYLGIYGFVWCLFSCGCAIGVVLGVGFLLYYQVCLILVNISIKSIVIFLKLCLF